MTLACPACEARAVESAELRQAVKRLTARELDVAILACKLSREGVAKLIHLSPHTIADYLKHIYRKLDVVGRVEMAVILMKCGHL